MKTLSGLLVVLFVLSLGIAMGCGAGDSVTDPPPRLEVVNFAAPYFAYIGAYTMEVTLHNPTEHDIELQSVVYAFCLSNNDYFSGTDNNATVVPANSAVVALVTMDTLEVGQPSMKLIFMHGTTVLATAQTAFNCQG